jgi:hypothetical protein
MVDAAERSLETTRPSHRRHALPALDDSHERLKRLNKCQAQKLSPAARRVRRINSGSLASRRPSSQTRQTWATAIKPKTDPVVIRYAFMGK